MESDIAPLSEHQQQLVGDCAGRPARVSFFVPNTKQLLTRVYGGIDEVAPGRAIIISCNSGLGALPPGCPTVVEVAVRGEVTILHTTLETTDGPYAVVLNWPHSVRTQTRRQHPRVDVALPLHFVLEGTHATRQGMIDNLSAGGLAFTTAERVAVETELSIAFALGSGLFFLSIRASVVRCTPLVQGGYQVGVRFIDLQPDAFQHLTEWVQQRMAAAEAGYR
jgi:hypothetical protein